MREMTWGARALGAAVVMMLGCGAPPPRENTAPVIESMRHSAQVSERGEPLSLGVTAHDPDEGDTLTYAWTAASGTFSAPSSAETEWRPDATSTEVELSVTVTDSAGASVSRTVTVWVRSDDGIPIVIIRDLVFRDDLAATPSAVRVGETTTVEMPDSSELLGEPLTYSWHALDDCPGTWTDQTSARAWFTPSALPRLGECTCTLIVNVQGPKGRGSGIASVCVSAPTP